MENGSSAFFKQGFEIFSYLSESEFSVLKSFAIQTLSRLFEQYAKRSVNEQDILQYHIWGRRQDVPHSEMLRAKNRHMLAPKEIESLLINPALKQLLEKIGMKRFKLWDEGLGWLAFRLIRPGPGDGYPFSCKNWGPAKNVFSLWIPIVGFTRELMICLIPGSHLKEYPKYLPKDTHFTKDEYRLSALPAPEDCVRPKFDPGQALLFHPKTLHAEEVEAGVHTRFNLEFRIEPV